MKSNIIESRVLVQKLADTHEDSNKIFRLETNLKTKKELELNGAFKFYSENSSNKLVFKSNLPKFY